MVVFGTAFLGVAMLKGFDTRISFFALMVILSSAFCSGFVYFFLRKIGKTEHPIVVVNYFLCIATLVGGFFSAFNWVQPKGYDWLPLLSMGLFGFIAQYFMTKAMSLVEVNIITPFKYVEVIFTLLAALIFFGEYQTWQMLLAMLVIVVSLIANVWVKTNEKFS